MWSTTPVDAEQLRYTAQEMVLESGARILHHAAVLDTLMEGKALQGVVVLSKGERIEIRAKVTIDCTGDGDVAALAGVPFEKGRSSDGKMQRMSLVFRMGNVDLPRNVRQTSASALPGPLCH